MQSRGVRDIIAGMDNVIIERSDGLGALWVMGWLFTIGYLRLSFWKGVLAAFIWPYYLRIAIKKAK